MENQMQQLVPVSAEDLLKKCKCREDLTNLCRELGKSIKYDFFV